MTDDQGFLRGGKVYLRGMTREDLNDYRRWLDNPDATRYMESGWKPTSDGELESLYRLSTEQNDTVVFVIVDRKSGRSVGIVGLYVIQWICRRADFRILIGDNESRDAGLGTEAARLVVDYAFDRLNLETVYLGVNVENGSAIRSYEKAGFQREGTRRKLVYRNSRYYDILMMSVIREEWLKHRLAK